MKAMVDNLKLCKQALGDGVKRIYDSERVALAKQWKNAEGKIDGNVALPH
jgi:sialic acid synthase SpsE